MDEMTFSILSDAGSGEPFFVLVNGIDWRSPAVLNQFVRTVCQMVRDGVLSYVVWGEVQKDSGGSIPSQSLFDELTAHVRKRLAAGEVLTEVPNDGIEYEFTLTSEGARAVERLYTEAKSRGQRIVGAIREFRTRTGRYPIELWELWPECSEPSDSPFNGCGVWWYKRVDDGSFFRFAYFTTCGGRMFYDSAKDTWVHDLPDVIH